MKKYPKIGIRPTIDGRQGGVRHQKTAAGVIARVKKRFGTRSNETHCVGLSFEGTAARCIARAVHRRRTTRTFASRNVFSPPYTPPEKMIGIFCVCGRKLCEPFVTACKNSPPSGGEFARLKRALHFAGNPTKRFSMERITTSARRQSPRGRAAPAPRP